MAGSTFSVVRGACFFNCANIEGLKIGNAKHESYIRSVLDQIATKAGYTLLGSSMGRYSETPDDGFSYDGRIGESALDIHTWPEHGTAQFVAHTCGDDEHCGVLFATACDLLKDLFQAVEVHYVGHLTMPIIAP